MTKGWRMENKKKILFFLYITFKYSYPIIKCGTNYTVNVNTPDSGGLLAVRLTGRNHLSQVISTTSGNVVMIW